MEQDVHVSKIDMKESLARKLLWVSVQCLLCCVTAVWLIRPSLCPWSKVTALSKMWLSVTKYGLNILSTESIMKPKKSNIHVVAHRAYMLAEAGKKKAI